MVIYYSNYDQHVKDKTPIFNRAILYGVPGTGKSHLAKTIAQELGITFIAAPAPYFADKFVGESAQRIKQLFDTAKKMGTPVLIFIDEIDAIATNRTGSTHEEHKALLTALLNELQDIQNNYNVYVIAATNVNPHDKEDPMKPRKPLLDPAVISRFGTAICEIKPLDKAGKTKFLLKLFKDYNIDPRCGTCNHDTCLRGNRESIDAALADRLADVLNSNFSNRDIESIIMCAQLKRKNAQLMEPGSVKHFCHYIKEAIEDSGKVQVLQYLHRPFVQAFKLHMKYIRNTFFTLLLATNIPLSTMQPGAVNGSNVAFNVVQDTSSQADIEMKSGVNTITALIESTEATNVTTPTYVNLTGEPLQQLQDKMVEVCAKEGIVLEILEVNTASEAGLGQAQITTNMRLAQSRATQAWASTEKYGSHGNQGYVTLGDHSRMRETVQQQLHLSKKAYDDYQASRSAVYDRGAYQKTLSGTTIGEMAILSSALQKNIQESEKNINQQRHNIVSLQKRYDVLAAKAGLAYAITKNYEYVNDRPAIELMQLEKVLYETKLALAKSENYAKVLSIQLESNKQHTTRLNKEYVDKYKKYYDQQSLIQIKLSIKAIDKNSKAFLIRVKQLKHDKETHQELLKNYQDKLQTLNWFWDTFGKSRSNLEDMIKIEQNLITVYTMEIVEQQQAFDSYPTLHAYLQEKITQEEAALKLLPAPLMTSADVDSTMNVSQALERTEQENHAVHTLSYKLQENTLLTLDRLGVTLVTDLIKPFSGTYAQHVVHKQFIETLDKMGTIQSVNPQIDQLLQAALAFNSTGRDLNRQQKIEAALSAKSACDAIVDYAKTVADLVLAAGEGLIEGAFSTAELADYLATKAYRFGTSEKVREHVYEKFNNAVLAVGKFVTSVGLNQDQKMYAFLTGDQQAIHEFYGQDKVTGEKLHAFFGALEQRYYETPLRNQVKAVSRNFTEMYLLGKIGGALFDGGVALADAIKLEAIAASTDVATLLRNPQQALAKEVIELAVQTVDKDAALVESVIEFIQKDSEFLTAAQNNLTRKTAQFIEHLEEKGARYRTLKTGERCRLVYPKDIVEAETIWASNKYEEIRALTDDVRIIAQNTDLPESQIKFIKDHLFYNEHILDGRIARFDSDRQIASAWDRLYKGDFIQNDLNLLEHEYYEAKFEKALNLNYRDAHKMAEDSGKAWYDPE